MKPDISTLLKPDILILQRHGAEICCQVCALYGKLRDGTRRDVDGKATSDLCCSDAGVRNGAFAKRWKRLWCAYGDSSREFNRWSERCAEEEPADFCARKADRKSCRCDCGSSGGGASDRSLPRDGLTGIDRRAHPYFSLGRGSGEGRVRPEYFEGGDCAARRESNLCVQARTGTGINNNTRTGNGGSGIRRRGD